MWLSDGTLTKISQDMDDCHNPSKHVEAAYLGHTADSGAKMLHTALIIPPKDFSQMGLKDSTLEKIRQNMNDCQNQSKQVKTVYLGCTAANLPILMARCLSVHWGLTPSFPHMI
ncbi:hypothetical protein Pst134EA_007563 [Puccinia striiformis f. sp. tritici]|uniref:hypothetical protein n=1 Tax=Puccinia striiformis f. sp. tritici TaxID=168172 RepID=UPI0020076835|nr:hypothetical protein Pst134EA_007563 [Puccinia striiformis f. sp. tritici]KAH9460508.1 hypothetical protein Pst134EB_008679 [Puccinia striiformis f. sp. tritici]KAH9470298.1 hypothetical protein Pst134EA_007563 [Puccinia striiformis f. sp. tritici]